MAEKLTLNHQQFESLLKSPEQREALPTAAQAEALRPGEIDPQKKLEAARQTVHETATQDNPLKKLEAAEKAATPASATYVNRELKSITLKRELQLIRRKLPAPQRTLSKVIHQPFVRVASEVTGQTLSRPSGLLGGSLVAFIGTSSYLYLAKHLGFSYNYIVFLILFAGGFVLGLLLELCVHWATTSRRHSD